MVLLVCTSATLSLSLLRFATHHGVHFLSLRLGGRWWHFFSHYLLGSLDLPRGQMFPVAYFTPYSAFLHRKDLAETQ